MNENKKEECPGCIGFADEHTCEGFAQLQKMKELTDPNNMRREIDRLTAENEWLFKAVKDTDLFIQTQINRERSTADELIKEQQETIEKLTAEKGHCLYSKATGSGAYVYWNTDCQRQYLIEYWHKIEDFNKFCRNCGKSVKVERDDN